MTFSIDSSLIAMHVYVNATTDKDKRIETILISFDICILYDSTLHFQEVKDHSLLFTFFSLYIIFFFILHDNE